MGGELLVSPISRDQAAIIFSFAKGATSGKVCIGVLPKLQRPRCRSSLIVSGDPAVEIALGCETEKPASVSSIFVRGTHFLNDSIMSTGRKPID